MMTLDETRQATGANLRYEEALVSPCQECNAVCCYYLPLQVLPARTLMEIDYIRYLLHFPRVVAGYSMGGQWSMYWAVPCRHLDLEARLCKVHGTAEQPRTCTAYNEHDCWYRRALNGESKGFLRLDRHLMERLLPMIAFDGDRNVAAVPTWAQMIDLCTGYPLGSEMDRRGWVHPMAKGNGSGSHSSEVPGNGHKPSSKTISELMQDPCAGCEAPCCRYLYFPLPVPTSFMQVDYIRFSLNFPGTECVVSPLSWWLLLRADCECLDAESRQCTLYGEPERPLRCTHLNQWDCGQYKRLLHPDSGFHRMDWQGFAELVEQIRFDDSGQIVQLPGPVSG